MVMREEGVGRMFEARVAVVAKRKAGRRKRDIMTLAMMLKGLGVVVVVVGR